MFAGDNWGHGFYFRLGTYAYFCTNRHTILGDETNTPSVIRFSIQTVHMTRPTTFNWTVVAEYFDILILAKYNKMGNRVDPEVKPLDAIPHCLAYGAVTAELLGCKLCDKPTAYDTINLPSNRYKINTVSGDCGRPVVYYDKWSSPPSLLFGGVFGGVIVSYFEGLWYSY